MPYDAYGPPWICKITGKALARGNGHPAVHGIAVAGDDLTFLRPHEDMRGGGLRTW
jgi:hypothetical protein